MRDASGAQAAVEEGDASPPTLRTQASGSVRAARATAGRVAQITMDGLERVTGQFRAAPSFSSLVRATVILAFFGVAAIGAAALARMM